ncbi:MAG TPA: SDR family oxidoreductase [Pyrinomonadaceae bacterium]|nr:SDR family oxidoreductase [Pyrinomonadaceae bacterium]
MSIKLKKLSDQVIVITGASSGIGLVTARLASARGARLVLNSRNEAELRRIAIEINQTGGQAIGVPGDVGNFEDVRRVGDAAMQLYGGFDTWVNNAGVSIYGPVLDQSLEDHRRLFETNYWGVVHGSMVACGHLRTRGGALINVGSVLSDRAIPIQGTYCASKHAVKGYTDALRMELEEEGAPVSVTLIKPSAVDTPYIHHAKNLLPVEPLNPPPVYAPETVAEAILHCAENPERDVIVGGGGKALTAMSYYAPRVTDKVMEATMFDLQKSEEPRAAHNGDNLHSSAQDGAERGGYPGHVAESSIYTRASLHPWMVGAVVAGAGLVFAMARRSARGRNGDGKGKH